MKMKVLTSKFRLVIGLVVACQFTLTATSATAIEVLTEVSRDAVFLEEPFTLTLTINDAPQFSQGPDLEPLKSDFYVLHQSTHTEVYITNGEQRSTRSWQIQIMPLRTGTLTIPALVVDGEVSDPVTIEVTNFVSQTSSQGEDLFIQIQTEPQKPYVREKVILAVRLFFAAEIRSGELVDPKVVDADVTRVGVDRQFQVQLGDKDYLVIERRFLVFPQKSGQLLVEDVAFRGEIVVRDSSNNPRLLRVDKSAEPTRIQVKPRPSGATDGVWLPAENLVLIDSWDSGLPEFEAGKPVKRIIEMRATGVRGLQLPGLSYQGNDTLRIYGSQPVRNTDDHSEQVVGRQVEEFVIVPQEGESIEIPEFYVVWWDITEDREKVARIPSISVQANLSASAESNSDSGTAIDTQPNITSLQDANIPSREETSFWKLASLILAAAWLATLYFWIATRLRNRDGCDEQHKRTKVSQSQRRIQSTIRHSCKTNNASAAAQNILRWGHTTWPKHPPKNLIDFGNRISSNALREELQKLDRYLYSDDSAGWQGDQLWNEFKNLKLFAASTAETKKISSPLDVWRTELKTLWPERKSSAT